MKKKIARIVLILFCITGISFVVWLPIHLNRERETEMGTILHKSEELKQAKHSTNHNMYFTMQFEDRIEDYDVTTHCYLTHEVGDKVFFEKRTTKGTIILEMIGAIFTFITIIILLVFIVIGIAWLFDIKL